MDKKERLEESAKDLQDRLRDLDANKPDKNDQNLAFWQISRKAISDRLTQVGRELRQLG
jgi:hypothetical protein